MRSASSPPNQAAKCGVCLLTTSQSRRFGIQTITATDPAHPTRPIIAAFFFIQTALLRVNLRKSYNQTAILRANLKMSSETTFGGRYHDTMIQQTSTSLTQQPFLHNQAPAPTADQLQSNPVAVPVQLSTSTNCRPAPA